MFSGLVMLRTHEASSPISEFEAVQLANSLYYVLGSSDLPPASLNNALANDPFTFYVRQVKHLEERVEALLVIRKRVCELMPPIRNVSLRDTLGSIGKIRDLYDIRFRAHEVPCDIQYQLSCPVDNSLMGIDYLEAWISELLKVAVYIGQLYFSARAVLLRLSRASCQSFNLLKSREDLLERVVERCRDAR